MQLEVKVAAVVENEMMVIIEVNQSDTVTNIGFIMHTRRMGDLFGEEKRKHTLEKTNRRARAETFQWRK
ncbi:Hypothetical predicted protein [Octopus vulgaris]|uniref:Uncharacterized protein n=1 Tax=Octopus vulgaris TaxID=6645 RepID=A0AA36FB77_OCTVU|nr:Hypothetical predicted protein [Octopus vulgaris]